MMRAEAFELEGLSGPAQILVDRWGIPHLRADSFLDVFFVQGFNAARERLWQIDLWRKRGLGLLSRDFGPGYLEQDRAARLFLYRGDMAREWASYGDDAEAISGRFVAGINAFVDLCEREPERLPPEFREMGTRPARWHKEDLVRIRSHGMLRNALSEHLRSHVIARGGPGADLFRQDLQPAHDVTKGRDDLLAPLPLQALDTLKLATAPVTFHSDRLKARVEEAGAWRRVTPSGDVERYATGEGSNNWAIHGSRTPTGRPILAGDPHRAPTMPSLRYIVHLTAPGFDAIGAGEPALPGIAMGHNGTAAFSLTLFFGQDQEDLYTYETHPEDPDLYRFGDGWERIREVCETVPLASGEEAPVVLRFTRHGPVLADYPDQRRALAIRTVWLEPGTAPYFQSIVAMRAKTFERFRQDLRGWGVPAVNFAYADTAGDIGWAVAGFSPVRPNWDGLLPVPGDGRFEWSGFLDHDKLPSALNPREGFVATANEMNLSAEWQNEHGAIGYEWANSSRVERLREVLSTPAPHSLENSQALQNDILSVTARRICALLKRISPTTEVARQPLDLLADWDFRLGPDSAPAALFEAWMSQYLRPAVIAANIADPHARALAAPGSLATIVAYLEKSSGPATQHLLLETLDAAWDWCESRLGPDPEQWAWGDIHGALFVHPLSAIRPDQASQLNVGPLPAGGSESTPLNGMYRASDFGLVFFATFRMVLDVGDWDRSVCINCPGQSGRPDSPHYADLAPLWAAGEYVPMLYSTAAVDAAAEEIFSLQPASSPAKKTV